MSDLRKEALQALEDGEIYDHFGARWGEKRIEALRAALAQSGTDWEAEAADQALTIALMKSEQEAVAWMVYTLDGKSVCVTDNPADFTDQHKALPLYTAPPSAAKPHKRKPLTDAEIDVACGPCHDSDLARAFRKEFIKRFRIVYERLPAPPCRQPLTEEEVLSVLRLSPPEPSLWPHLKDEAVVGDVQKAVLAIARAIERAHGIGGDA